MSGLKSMLTVSGFKIKLLRSSQSYLHAMMDLYSFSNCKIVLLKFVTKDCRSKNIARQLVSSVPMLGQSQGCMMLVDQYNKFD